MTDRSTNSDFDPATLPLPESAIKNHEYIPPQSGAGEPAENVLLPELASCLPHDTLYTHQAEALRKLQTGANLCVSTPTASGKTLIYALHIAAQRFYDDNATAVLIYPTKALSRDQQTELTELFETLNLDLEIYVYDGDSPQQTKETARTNADIIITNFAGLNAYLPHHTSWDDFFEHLSTVVIDESHSYTGILGMHATWITRRLDRIANHYGANPQYICTSATIGNPKQHSEDLINKPVQTVTNATTPHGGRDLYFLNPHDTTDAVDADTDESKTTGSAHRTASEILASLTAQDYQSLLFTDTRKMTELDAMWARRAVERMAETDIEDTEIRPYNAGHRKQDRRRIEDKLKAGVIDGVVSTSALEMGINIGSIDGVVLAGYPGTRQGFWQRLGRAGRGDNMAVGVFVPHEDQLNQYIVENPNHVLEDPVEDAVVNVDNNTVYAQHVRVAARELPLTLDDTEWFGKRLQHAIKMFKDGDEFIGELNDPHGVTYVEDDHPELSIDIYATSRETFDVTLRKDDGVTVELPNADASRAYRDFHPGAVYLYQGQRCEVVDFDQGERRIVLEPTDADYYTEVHREVTVNPVSEEISRELTNSLTLHFGEVRAKEYFPSYVKRDVGSDDSLGTEDTGIETPAVLRTKGMWLTVSPELKQHISDREFLANTGIREEYIMNGLTAAMNTIINLAPAELLIETRDLGGSVRTGLTEEGASAMFIYDAAPGGIGFARELYEQFEVVAEHAYSRITNCTCSNDEGCPKCVLSPTPTSHSDSVSKSAAVTLLKYALPE
ncbi:DEAD/DEAH box helicase [Salinibaculum rarum]|uniref:DEAD/DEAH box helicase n=1 Tax=Salinibaculum rarum TaxID=3058903 RepID=UPI00265EECEB|nr:DEAD/DEAH box helicase [Salinibaculum sp. KK48]